MKFRRKLLPSFLGSKSKRRNKSEENRKQFPLLPAYPSTLEMKAKRSCEKSAKYT
jgi:hypothetical protein